jgi:hypothetical protein
LCSVTHSLQLPRHQWLRPHQQQWREWWLCFKGAQQH